MVGHQILKHMNIEAAKIRLIKLIAEMQSEALVSQLSLFISKINEKSFESGSNGNEGLSVAKDPAPDTISLEALKSEQGYDPKKLNDHLDILDRSIWEGEDAKELMQAI